MNDSFSGIKTFYFEVFLHIFSMVLLLIIKIFSSGLKMKIGIKDSSTIKQVFPDFLKVSLKIIFYFTFFIFKITFWKIMS